jgi:hypothetical protein
MSPKKSQVPLESLLLLAPNFVFLDSQTTSRFFVDNLCANVACKDVHMNLLFRTFLIFQNVLKTNFKIKIQKGERRKLTTMQKIVGERNVGHTRCMPIVESLDLWER